MLKFYISEFLGVGLSNTAKAIISDIHDAFTEEFGVKPKKIEARSPDRNGR